MSTEFYNRNWRMPKSSNSSKVSNYSMEFDSASNNWIELIDSSNIFNGLTAFSVSLWLNPSATQAAHTSPFSFRSASTQYLKLNFGATPSNNQLQIAFRNSATATATSSVNSIPLNTWTNVIIVFDASSSLSLYVNGSLDGQDTTGLPTSAVQSTNIYIGTDGGNTTGRDFNGKIDHVAIFDYALSSSQVTSLYGNSTDGVGNPMAITGGRKPIAYYPIGDYAAFNGSEYLVNNGALQDYVFNFVPNDFINVSNNINITSNFSYSLWYKSNSNSGTAYEFLLSKENASATINQFSIFHLFTGGSGRLLAHIYDSLGTGFSLDTGSGLSAEVWHHVVFCYSPSNYIRLYLDGVLKEENTTNIPSSIRSITGENIRIGGRKNNSMFLNGEMSNVQMWSGTLTDGGVSVGATAGGEVATLYNNGTPYMGTQPQSSNLQGWWKLDASATFDGSNWSIPDDSSNSNTGTSSGMTAANLVQSTLNITTPYSRYSLDFDGTNGYIDVAYSEDLNVGANATWSMWLNWEDITKIHCLASRYDVGQISWYIQKPTAQNIEFGIGSGLNLWPISGFSGVVSKWFHLCFVYDGSESGSDKIKFYVNGSLQTIGSTAGTIPTTLPNTTSKLRLGNFSASFTTRTFEGLMSNFSLWNTSLTSTQVTELYNSGKPGNLNNHSAYSNLVSWWQLGENSSFDGTNWTVLNEISTGPNGVSANMGEDAIVNGVGTTANGLSDGMGGADNIIGDAPYSTANAVSYGMGVDALSTSVPS